MCGRGKRDEIDLDSTFVGQQKGVKEKERTHTREEGVTQKLRKGNSGEERKRKRNRVKTISKKEKRVKTARQR